MRGVAPGETRNDSYGCRSCPVLALRWFLRSVKPGSSLKIACCVRCQLLRAIARKTTEEMHPSCRHPEGDSPSTVRRSGRRRHCDRRRKWGAYLAPTRFHVIPALVSSSLCHMAWYHPPTHPPTARYNPRFRVVGIASGAQSTYGPCPSTADSSTF